MRKNLSQHTLFSGFQFQFFVSFFFFSLSVQQVVLSSGAWQRGEVGEGSRELREGSAYTSADFNVPFHFDISHYN